VRFYLDEDLSQQIAAIARTHNVDVVSSHECGRDGLPDEEQMKLAAADGRCMVTRNYADYAMLTRTFWELGSPHAGVLLVAPSLANDRFTDIAEALVEYDRSHRQGLLAYQVDYLRPVGKP